MEFNFKKDEMVIYHYAHANVMNTLELICVWYDLIYTKIIYIGLKLYCIEILISYSTSFYVVSQID